MDSMTEPGLNIHKEILIRLQVSDLIRCKRVCKSWNSLISSERFVKSHLKRQQLNEIGDTRIIVSNGASSMCVKKCVNSRQGECQLLGSSNGLVCICCSETDFFVVNPSTREVKELIDHPGDFDGLIIYVSGFGYDSSIDDFKVVIGYRCLPNDLLMFDVLELKTNIWRSIDVGWDYDDLNGNGILCNGAIHWLHRDTDNIIMVSFDLSKEVFLKKRLPILDDEWTLGTMKNHLCFFRLPKEKNEEIEMWVMSNDQVSWERKSPPPGYDANKITIDYIPHRKFFSGDINIWLLEEGASVPVLVQSIDHRHSFRPHEHIRLSTYSECNYNFNEHVFVKSLVSPHGMGSTLVRDGEGCNGNIDDVIS